MKRTFSSAGLSDSIPKSQCKRTCLLQQRGTIFPLLDLPAEIRNMIYHHVFAPTSSSDKQPTRQSTLLRLSYISADDPAVKLLKRTANRIYCLRPSYFATFTLSCKRLYNETLPILAHYTILSLSGADFDYFRTNLPPSTFVGDLLNEAAKYTMNIAVEASILRANTKLQNQLVSGEVFSNLRRLTVHTAGPAQVLFSDVRLALSAEDAEKLLHEKKWPSALLNDAYASILDKESPTYHVTPSGDRTWIAVLSDMRAKSEELNKGSCSGNQFKLKNIEVVYKLPLKSTIMSTRRTSSTTFTGSEVVVDFDTNEIVDVSFHKLQRVPVQHREISTAMAFLDRPNAGAARSRPRVAETSHAISFQPQQ